MADSRLMPAPRRRGLSLTSLIDVIFLLLLFFMLTSTFTKLGELELTAAPQGAGSAETPPAFVQLGAESLRLNARDIPLEDLRAALTELAGPEGTALIALAEGVEAQRLVDILAALRGAPFAVRVLG
ncbi:ExbD/TolR family protein [Pararhodobacter aggregans]|nr:biopolymer transporter ExbD [Pararhodobacter aggregans]PTX03990.1 outer membrane transport energization protein ExbD [Pararhodobacter aggregans]